MTTQTVQLRRSAVASNVPTTAALALGEIAINTYDGKLFIKKNNGTESIVEIGASSGGGGGASLSDANTWTARQTFSDGLIANGLTISTTNIQTPPIKKRRKITYAEKTQGLGGTSLKSCIAFDPSGRFFYQVNTGSNTIVSSRLGGEYYEDYQLSGTVSSLATGTRPWGLVCSSTGRFVYVTNQTSNTVSQYSVNQATGALTSIGSAIACGTTPYHLAIDPKDRFVYTANSASGTISQFSINQVTGALTEITTPITAGTAPQWIACDPTGRFVYATNSSSSNVSQFSINQTTGALTLIGTSMAGTTPRSICIDKTGRFAYVANEGSNTISYYSIDNTTGALALISSITTSAQPHCISMSLLGDFLYVCCKSARRVNILSASSTTGHLDMIDSYANVSANSPIYITSDKTGHCFYVTYESSNIVSTFIEALPVIQGGTGVTTLTDLKAQCSTYLGKGELLVGYSSGVNVALPVGADGQALVADSSSAYGVSWAASGGGGGGSTVQYVTMNGGIVYVTANYVRTEYYTSGNQYNFPDSPADGTIINFWFVQGSSSITWYNAYASFDSTAPTYISNNQSITWAYNANYTTWYVVGGSYHT